MSDFLTFEAFPKLHRLSGPVIITEKIDGTNAAVVIDEIGTVLAQSRTRFITPQNDNHGFARWVYDNADTLREKLGIGRHFGEWWGGSIQRGYGVKDKRFSLFNTSRWTELDFAEDYFGMWVVPVLFTGTLIEAIERIPMIMADLKENGSKAAPGYMNPEGIVLYDTRSGVGFKKTFDYDDTGKGGIRDVDGNIISMPR